jgi:hypothetical protein
MEHTRQQSQQENKEALRSLYDSAYRLIYGREAFEEAVRTAFNNEHVRKTGRTIVIIGIALLGVVLFLASSLIAQHFMWLNRPAAEELMAAPYNLSNQMIADVNFAADSPTIVTLQEAGYRYISDNANIPLVTCLGSLATQGEEPVCSVTSQAINTETALFLGPDNKPVTMVVATFADDQSTYTALRELHEYSRTMGLDGNFVLNRNQSVPYFFNKYGNHLSFTWKQGEAIYIVSSSETSTINSFIETLMPSNIVSMQ